MRLAIMQPYFLPYLGYFQLMSVADKLLLLDDVAYINGGWINRNRIAIRGRPHWLTLPLAQASQNRLINQIAIIDDPAWKRKTLRTVELSYGSAPFLHDVLPLFSDILKEAQGSLSTFLFHHLRRVADYIGIPVRIERTSEKYPKEALTGQLRILDICTRERATGYVNLPGGRNLYDPRLFMSAGVELLFLEPNLQALPLQYSGDDGPSLSILDLLMLNSLTTIREAMQMFRLDTA